MRISAVVVALLICSTSARADEPAPPAIAIAIKKAATAHKPLLLEFSAEWCHPCKVFAEKTLPDPRVQAALEAVVFVHYDAEVGPGIEAASKYSVSSFPTFLVIDEHGVERNRQEGIPSGESGIAEFTELAVGARLAVMNELAVRATIAAAPNDAKVRLSAATWFIDRKMRADSTNKTATSADLTRATTELVRMRRLDQWRRQLLGEKLALIEASPR